MNEVEAPVDRGMLDRLAVLVKEAGGPVAAARALSVSRNTVDLWLKGKSKVPLDGATRLAQLRGRTLDWLVLGAVEDKGQMQLHSNDVPVPDGFVPVPVLSVQASAGSGAIAIPFDGDTGNVVAFRETWLRTLGFLPGRVYILWAVGDSMQPTIRDGDMLLVDRAIDQVIDDGIYVLVVGSRVMVKRIQTRLNGSVVLKSDNARYDEETIPADEVPSLIVEGRVRWVGGPI